MAQVVFIVVAGWLCLLALGPFVGFVSDLADLARAMAVAALVGWITALIVSRRFRRYQPAPRHDTLTLQDASTPVRMAARATVTNLALLLVSFLLGIFLCELALRYFYPKYQGVAEAQYERDPILLWSRPKNSRGWFRNPDTDSYHPYHHNNLRMRQHRDFTEEDLDSAISIGFFGDSFLENQGMSSQYSLTEPLDYLLNLSNKRFNTLNFAVSSYGTGQSFLRYEHFQHAESLDYVFYVFTDNDLRNIYENELFYVDEAGKLTRHEAIRTSWWTRNVSSLHITYLLLDVSQRFPFIIQDVIAVLEENLLRSKALQSLKEARNARYGDPIAMDIERDFFEGRAKNEHVENTIAIFLQLIERWRMLAAERGSEFYIVLLPRPHEARLTTVLGDEFEVINLYECFNDYVKNYHELGWGSSSPYRFKRDAHWNEAGNQLAVVCLYRFLEQEVGLPVLSDDALREAFFRYYSSFEGWMPDERWIKRVPVPPHVREGIRDKYLALEKPESEAD